MIEEREMRLEIEGIGIVFCCPKSTKHIAEGSDYLTSHFTTEEDVQSHLQKGDIVGFGTCSPGNFILRFHDGYPGETYLLKCDFKLRLGLSCNGGVVMVRDLYDFLDWKADCPAEQKFELADGFYHITLCSNRPPSGLLGDQQVIECYFQKLDQFPRLAQHGIPTLCA